ncbi:MAG: AMP-binding protein [Candidatus Rokubacteria bacterium]|nr:AMP-binding protein [Candidatus Rokubacteria bacterium]
MNIATILEQRARYRPHAVALCFGDRAYTFHDLDRGAGGVAEQLVGLGVKPGHRVAVLVPSRPEFILAYYGCQKVGASVVSINSAFKRDEIAHVLKNSEPSVLITTVSSWPSLPPRQDVPSVVHYLTIDGAPEGARALDCSRAATFRAVDRERDDTASILYTSGTTGSTKGVMLTHANVSFNTLIANHYLAMTADDRILCAVPLFHTTGQNSLMNGGINAGATVFLHERFSAEHAVEAIARHRITVLIGVPTMYIRLLEAAGSARFLSLRRCFSAGAPMPPDVAAEWRERSGVEIEEAWGLTETTAFATYNHPVEVRRGSAGTPILSVDVQVVDGQDQPVADGEVGELVVRGPNIMKGYLGDPEATARALRNGWLHSGDVGYLGEDGYLYVVDRLKDMVNVSGFKVSPTEVEHVLSQHPGVLEVSVAPRPHAVRGECVAAFVVLKRGAMPSAGELVAYCRDRMASYKVPSSIDFVQALPKGATGKVLRRELRDRAAAMPPITGRGETT